MGLNTTLCYIERNGSYLMLHRIKKKNDLNKNKWIGIGGKFEEGESPEECLVREVCEETGLHLTSYRLRGIVTFVCPPYPTEYMYLYTACAEEAPLAPCEEGELAWVEKEKVPSLPLWEGDRIFLRLLAEEHPFFSLKLVYEGDALVRAVLDGKEITEKE